MNYRSYLFDAQGNKIPKAQRHGKGSRARMNEVYEYNKRLHSKRSKRETLH